MRLALAISAFVILIIHGIVFYDQFFHKWESYQTAYFDQARALSKTDNERAAVSGRRLLLWCRAESLSMSADLEADSPPSRYARARRAGTCMKVVLWRRRASSRRTPNEVTEARAPVLTQAFQPHRHDPGRRLDLFAGQRKSSAVNLVAPGPCPAKAHFLERPDARQPRIRSAPVP